MAVETAVVMPLALLVIIGIVEYGRLITLRQLLENAAREGVRYAVVRVVDDTTTDNQVLDAVEKNLAGFQNQLVGYNKSTNIQVFQADPTTGANIGSWKNAGFGKTIAVKIFGQVKFALGTPMTMTVQSTMYSEAN